MPTTLYGPGHAFLAGLHTIGALAFVVGALFLLFWAYKHLPAAKLWKYGWILLGAGAVVSILTMVGLSMGAKGKVPAMMNRTQSGQMYRNAKPVPPAMMKSSAAGAASSAR